MSDNAPGPTSGVPRQPVAPRPATTAGGHGTKITFTRARGTDAISRMAWALIWSEDVIARLRDLMEDTDPDGYSSCIQRASSIEIMAHLPHLDPGPDLLEWAFDSAMAVQDALSTGLVCDMCWANESCPDDVPCHRAIVRRYVAAYRGESEPTA